MTDSHRNLPGAFALKRLLAMVTVSALALSGASGVAAADADKALIMLSSASQQTRGMAMVLGNAMLDRGVSVRVLLCDSAGDMALEGHDSEALAPRNVTPEQLLGRLMSHDVPVEVCALYLPNSEHGESDLRDGVGVAQPPAIAEHMMNSNTRVFSF